MIVENIMFKFGDGFVYVFESGLWDYDVVKKVVGEDKIGVVVYLIMKIGDKEV